MEKRPPCIVLTGPTAVGKTALSIRLAKALNGSIISADSMQIYKRMDIGSAKIMPEEMEGIPHYLVDELEPTDEFNVYIFQKMARRAMQEIYQENRIPIITGGTGFYIQALLKDIDFSESKGASPFRAELEEIARTKGPFVLHQMLQELDPAAAAEIHPQNVKRVVRAIEFYKETGSPISEHNQREREKESPYDYVYFVLTDDRKRLYERINQRVDLMLAQGLTEEVRALQREGMTADHQSMKGLGYREYFPYFEGQITLPEVIEQIKLDTRHFAKRQLTWFKREKNVVWINRQDYASDEEILQFMIDRWNHRNELGEEEK